MGEARAALRRRPSHSEDTLHRTPETQILGPYPTAIAKEFKEIDGSGRPRSPFVVRDCANGVCALYQLIQGTSMAAPHAAGVAALIVSKYGTRDTVHGGATLSPTTVETILRDTASEHACPTRGSWTTATASSTRWRPSAASTD